MNHPLRTGKGSLQATVIVLALSLIGPASAINYFWTGAVGTDAADPNNWTNDGGAAMVGTLPSNDDTVRIGSTPDWVVKDMPVQPVLTSEWVSRDGNPYAGWWLLMGTTGIDSENSLTIGDGAYIEVSHNDFTLRNGTTLRVTGQRTGGGPSIVIAPRFHIGHNGDTVPAATGTVIVEKNGYLKLDPNVSRKGSGGWQVYMGSATKALIEIRDNGILELVQKADGTVIPRFVFAYADPAQNRIVISGKGQLILTGEPATIAQVAETDTSLQSLIDTGLIASANPDEKLTFSGTNPTVVKLAGQRISNPNPANGESNLDRTVVLGWDASTMTDRYDVYLGTDAAAVTDAARSKPLGVLQNQGQTQASYPLSGVLTLQYGQTYYWRVDETDVPPTGEILKGKVWSFSVEPFAIPILPQAITAAASGHSPDQGPEKTIDRSGLDANDCHSTALTDMWLSDTAKPVWIEYAFDQAYKIRQMQVWNYNGEDFLTALGLKEVLVEYSADGVTWTTLPGVTTLEEAFGTPDYTANTTVNFGDIAAGKVRIAVKSNWGDSPLFNMYGLSEVRFLHVPVAARFPSPASGATEVALDATLAWRAGREAAEHKVYLATDPQAVAGGTAPAATVQQTGYSPSSLALGTTYYWRVDEVNAAQPINTWPGPVWSFTTKGFIVVDDIEGYNDTEKAVYKTWIDGYGTANNGCQVGNDAPPYTNTATVHGGRQSMPLRYTNTGSFTFSEATRTFDAAQDWTASGIKTLRIYFYGSVDNTAASLYVKINGTKVAYTGDAANVSKAQWTQWDVDLSTMPATVLQGVTTLTLGAGTGNGNLLVDDIRLY